MAAFCVMVLITVTQMLIRWMVRTPARPLSHFLLNDFSLLRSPHPTSLHLTTLSSQANNSV